MSITHQFTTPPADWRKLDSDALRALVCKLQESSPVPTCAQLDEQQEMWQELRKRGVRLY